MKTLQDQYKLIKEGKGHKDVFLKEAKQMFPNYIRNAATFEEASNILKDKNVISENLVGIEPINTISREKESYEKAFEKFLEEANKKDIKDPNAEIKKVSQQVEDKLKNNFDRTDKKNPDNQIFGEIMKGYYCEMKDPKNADKTEEQLRDIVLKNLAKDPIYYTKNGMFGEKGVGFEMDVPGLGEPKEAKGKYKSSGYGDLKEVRGGGNYGIPTISPIGKSEGGKRFIPKTFPLPEVIKKRFGAHIVFNPSSGTLYISDILYNNLVKGYSNQVAIKKLIMDIPPMIKQILNKPDNYGPTTELPKEYRVYHPLNGVVERAKEDKFNKARTKQYWSMGDYLIPNLNIISTPEEEIYENKLRQVINTLIKQELISENQKYQKTIKEIEKASKLAELTTKMEALDKAIEEKNSRLNSIEESEEMKELVDRKAMKELQKEVKLLEKYKDKVLKMYEKYTGKKKKQVIDEDPINEADGDVADTDQMKQDLEDIKKTVDDISKTELFEEEPSKEYLDAKEEAEERYEDGEEIEAIVKDFPEFKEMLYQDLKGKYEG